MQAVSGFQSEVDLYGTLAVLADEDVQRGAYKDPSRHDDLWYGRGRYRDQVLEPIGDGQFYRLTYGGQRVFWDIVRIKPGPTHLLPEDADAFHVAYCSTRTGIKSAGNSCRTHALFGDLVVGFSIDELRAFTGHEHRENARHPA